MLGETLGKYRVLSRIGEGGMGVVYRAEHTLIGRIAAVKVLRPEMSANHDHVRRFFNEARAAASLHHPSLVDVYDYGHRPDGTAFIVMELLDGESLAQRLARGTLTADVALAITRQAASALHALHEQHIVHRDLKPANIFLIEDATAPNGVRAKVLDLGIAKLIGVRGGSDDSSATTAHGGLWGTPRYMAPEQCRNASDVDGRADVYSLGSILFEMLLGRTPFTYQNWGELVAAHIHERPPSPRDIDPALPHEIEAMILKALSKAKEDRYSMDELARASEVAWHNAIGSAPQPRFTPVPQPNRDAARKHPRPTPSVAAQVEELAPPPAKRPWLLIAVTGVALIAAAAGVTVRVLGREDATPAAPAVIAPAAQPVVTEIAPAPAPPSVAAPTGSDAPSATVELVVDSVPRGAYVYRASDGVRLGQTPLHRTFTQTDGMADFVVKLAGYRDRRVSLSTRENGSTVAKLEQAPRVEHTPAKRTPAVKAPTVLDPYGGQ